MDYHVVSHKYVAVCQNCEFVKSSNFHTYSANLGRDHLKEHPEHEVKVVTYEVREVCTAEQFL